MNAQNYTEKSQQALVKAYQYAQQFNHGQCDVIHLIRALLDDDENMFNSIIKELNQKGSIS